MAKMIGAILPGNSTVQLKQFDVPTPGHVQQSAEVISAVSTESIPERVQRGISRE